MAKNLLLVALPEELGSEAIEILKQKCDLCFTGVGKLRSFEATLAALKADEYANVINVGTCGSSKHPFATVLYPGRVAQGDIYLEPLFGTEQELLSTGDANQSIVSSDNFIGEQTPTEQLALLQPFDCMDMESYAIVRAVKFHAAQNNKKAAKLHLIKVVSDSADSSVGEWSQRIEYLRPTLLNAILEKLSTI